MSQVIWYFMFACICTTVNGVLYESCGSRVTNSIEYSVSNCTKVNKECPFSLGTNATLEARFIATNYSKSARVEIYGKILLLNLLFPLEYPDACTNWGLKCPIEVGSHQLLQINLPIQSYYPRLPVGVEMKLLNEDDAEILCVKFAAKIVD